MAEQPVKAQQLPTYQPGSAGWLEQRRTALGGSEIGAVLGLSPYESRFSLWHRKAGLVAPQEDKPEMEWGRRLETAVREKWLETHAPSAGHPDGEWASEMFAGTFLRDGWMLASPDWMVQDYNGYELRVLEVKTAHDDLGWGEPGTDQVPPHYLCQVRWYLGVLGLTRGHLAVLIGGSDYREYVIDQDETDLALMIREGRAFLDSIAAGQRPDIDASQQTYQVIRELHPEIDPEQVEIAPDLAGEYIAARLSADAEAARYQQASSRVLDAMGRAKHAVVDGTRVAYRSARKRADGTPGTPYLQIDRKALGLFTAKDAA